MICCVYLVFSCYLIASRIPPGQDGVRLPFEEEAKWIPLTRCQVGVRLVCSDANTNYQRQLSTPTNYQHVEEHLPSRSCRGFEKLETFARVRSFKCGLERYARPEKLEERLEKLEMLGKLARLQCDIVDLF